MPAPKLLLVVDELVTPFELPEFTGLEMLLMFGCNWTEAPAGGLIPSVCILSRLTSIKAKSTTTSGEALSKSLTIFSARRTWSGVPRITIASWVAELEKRTAK